MRLKRILYACMLVSANLCAQEIKSYWVIDEDCLSAKTLQCVKETYKVYSYEPSEVKQPVCPPGFKHSTRMPGTGGGGRVPVYNVCTFDGTIVDLSKPPPEVGPLLADCDARVRLEAVFTKSNCAKQIKFDQLLDAWQHDVRKLFEAMCKDKPEMETCKVMNAVPPAEQKN